MKILILFLLSINLVQAQEFQLNNTKFKGLFNKHRMGQPSNLPWAGSYWAYKTHGLADKTYKGLFNIAFTKSPAEKYDQFFNLGFSSYMWELKNHSCDQVDWKEQKGCRSWWGHCNAWAAAAIKEAEPREEIVVKGPGGNIKFSIGDQKAILTELYMLNQSLFVGTTNKSEKIGNWIFDVSHKDAKKLVGEGVTNYDAFWDVSPKTFFLVLTNYIGERETGVVIDRFTGDQVWNQPLVGYKFLPIRKADIREPVIRRENKLYPVLIRTNIFWANDSVAADTVSLPFDIKKATDKFITEGDFKYNDHFTGRSLAFFLYFDKKVKVSKKGKKISSAGNIVGEGVWYHQTDEGMRYVNDFNNTHPDFMWLPTKVSDSNVNNYRNKTFTSARVFKIFKKVTCTFNRTNLLKKIKQSYTESSRNKSEACKIAKRACKKDKKFGQKCKKSN